MSSFQAIAYAELQEPRHELLLKRSVALSRSWLNEFQDVSLEELAVEVSVRGNYRHLKMQRH